VWEKGRVGKEIVVYVDSEQRLAAAVCYALR
jgi:hypothetical protein